MQRIGGIVRRLAAVMVVLLAAGSCTSIHVEILASEVLGGRVAGTVGHVGAGNYIIDYLQVRGVEAMDGSTDQDAYREDHATGSNIIGRLPGTGPLADEIVMVGAHFDGTANCFQEGGTSTCNGAINNAAGVAIALEVAAAFFESDTPNQRTIVFAFWDQDAAGASSSAAWVAANPDLVADTVVYLNYDIQGSNLIPSLRDSTFALGAASGGAALEAAVDAAGASSSLALAPLSEIFGQNGSSYVPFSGASVPIVYFTDSTGRCAASSLDTVDISLDVDKLNQQRDIAIDLVSALAAGAAAPTFTAAPLATYDDAVVMLGLLEQGLTDSALFTPSQIAQALSIEADLAAIVDDGAAQFDGADVGTLLSGAATLIGIFSSGTCDGFLD